MMAPSRVQAEKKLASVSYWHNHKTIADVAISNRATEERRLSNALQLILSSILAVSSPIPSEVPRAQTIFIETSSNQSEVMGWIPISAEQETIQDIRRYFENSKWGQPCRAMFDNLASEDPRLLMRVVSSDVLEPALLTYAVEALGKAAKKPFEQECLNVILPMLNHPSALVREGAVYGLEPLLGNSTVIAHLKERFVVENSPGVREAISETIEG